MIQQCAAECNRSAYSQWHTEGSRHRGERMISQFFILSPRGDTIILRDYLNNVPKVRSVSQASEWNQRKT